MGKFLIVKGADFSENGIPFDPPAPDPGTEDLLPTFQSNALPLGTALTYNGGSNVGTASNMKRIACNKTTIVSGKTYIKMKLKDGFQLAMLAVGNNGNATTNADGTLSAKSTWVWATVQTFTIALSEYNTFAFNVRYANNVTEFASNEMSNVFDYIKAEDSL